MAPFRGVRFVKGRVRVAFDRILHTILHTIQLSLPGCGGLL